MCDMTTLAERALYASEDLDGIDFGAVRRVLVAVEGYPDRALAVASEAEDKGGPDATSRAVDEVEQMLQTAFSVLGLVRKQWDVIVDDDEVAATVRNTIEQALMMVAPSMPMDLRKQVFEEGPSW